jgi:hypothetical protein
VVQRWATGWMIGDSSPDKGWEIFSSPPCPDRLWDPPSLLSNGYQELFSGGEATTPPQSSTEDEECVEL